MLGAKVLLLEITTKCWADYGKYIFAMCRLCRIYSKIVSFLKLKQNFIPLLAYFFQFTSFRINDKPLNYDVFGYKDKESKQCLDFALMMADYCLMEQIKTFGEALQNQYVDASEEYQRYGANHSVFDQQWTNIVLVLFRTDIQLRSLIDLWSSSLAPRQSWIKIHFALATRSVPVCLLCSEVSLPSNSHLDKRFSSLHKPS